MLAKHDDSLMNFKLKINTRVNEVNEEIKATAEEDGVMSYLGKRAVLETVPKEVVGTHNETLLQCGGERRRFG